eukprot:gb/GECG01010738.1/.p1 GENE.gb/GECG01010738.1/~~gb/GECG01010738.1/.p1  ORF type:complete len:920 (+),score=101.89 gb/GECG01010738.1/:1-2760(+)
MQQFHGDLIHELRVSPGAIEVNNDGGLVFYHSVREILDRHMWDRGSDDSLREIRPKHLQEELLRNTLSAEHRKRLAETLARAILQDESVNPSRNLYERTRELIFGSSILVNQLRRPEALNRISERWCQLLQNDHPGVYRHLIHEESQESRATNSLRCVYRHLAYYFDPFDIADNKIEPWYQLLELEIGSSERVWYHISLSNLLGDREGTKAVLEGRKESGKSNWCHTLTKLWANPTADAPAWLCRYRWLLFIPLRGLFNRVEREKPSQSEDIPKFIDYWTSEGLMKYVLDNECYAGMVPPFDEVLFLLDGYDEVPFENDSSGIFAQILDYILYGNGSDACRHVIVTTNTFSSIRQHRPQLLNESRKFHLCQISKENRKRVVKEYIGDLRGNLQGSLLRDEVELVLKEGAVLVSLFSDPPLLKMLCWLVYMFRHRGVEPQAVLGHSAVRLTTLFEEAVKTLLFLCQRQHPDLTQDRRREFFDIMKQLANQDENIIPKERSETALLHLSAGELGIFSTGLKIVHPLRGSVGMSLIRCDWAFIHFTFQQFFRAYYYCDCLVKKELSLDDNSLKPTLEELFVCGSLVPSFLLGILSSESGGSREELMQEVVEILTRATWHISQTSDSELVRTSCVERYWQALSEISGESFSKISLPRDFSETIVDSKGVFGGIPSAISAGNENLCKWVIDHSNDPEELIMAGNVKGETALHIAAKMNGRLCNWLLSQVTPSQQEEFVIRTDFNNRSTLQNAVLNEDVDACRVLIEHLRSGEITNFLVWQDREGRTALHVAAMKGSVSICKWLFELLRGSSIESLVCLADRDGKTALHFAHEYGHPELFYWLTEWLSFEQLLFLVQPFGKLGKQTICNILEKDPWNLLPMEMKVDIVNYVVSRTHISISESEKVMDALEAVDLRVTDDGWVEFD